MSYSTSLRAWPVASSTMQPRIWVPSEHTTCEPPSLCCTASTLATWNVTPAAAHNVEDPRLAANLLSYFSTCDCVHCNDARESNLETPRSCQSIVTVSMHQSSSLPCAMHLLRSLRFSLGLSTLPYGRDSCLHTSKSRASAQQTQSISTTNNLDSFHVSHYSVKPQTYC